MKILLASLIFGISLYGNAFASDLEDLARDGYAVIQETKVDGEFEGCDFDKQIPLMNGMVFVCSMYGYSYSYMPKVYILQHIQSRDYKVIINDRLFRGKLYRR